MKKIIFLLLLAQAISCLYACSGCKAYSWRWGRKGIESVQCYCNCDQFGRANGKCLQCRHTVVAQDIKISNQ